MNYLLDTNILIAVSFRHHTAHERVRHWFEEVKAFSTCPVTQSGFLRIAGNPRLPYAVTMEDAYAMLEWFLSDKVRHSFIPDDMSFDDLSIRPKSHHQVTDFYLLELARQRKKTLATLDEALGTRGAFVLPG